MFDNGLLKYYKDYADEQGMLKTFEAIGPGEYSYSSPNIKLYYVRDGEWYDKTSTKYTQTSFEVETVVKSLKKIGFKEVKVCNFDLAEIVNPETENKVHIIATK